VRSIVVILVVAAFGAAAPADRVVLRGLPGGYVSGDAAAPPIDDDPLAVRTAAISDLTPDAAEQIPIGSRDVADEVPAYVWWYGCSPTAAGAVVAYWASQPGRGNLYKKGDVQLWSGDGATGTRRMVSSTGHIDQTAGHNLNGCASAADRSISCFLGTNPVTGGTFVNQIPVGLKAFVEWDDTSVYDMKDAYPASFVYKPVAYFAPFYFEDFKAKIDAGRPVLINVYTDAPGHGWLGHTVVGYGYDDDVTFNVRDPATGQALIAPGLAVMDTWTPGGGSQSDWVAAGGAPGVVEEYFDPNGVEWWPWVAQNGSSHGDYWDWMVGSVVVMDIAPEPASAALLSVAGLAILRRRRR